MITLLVARVCPTIAILEYVAVGKSTCEKTARHVVVKRLIVVTQAYVAIVKSIHERTTLLVVVMYLTIITLMLAAIRLSVHEMVAQHAVAVEPAVTSMVTDIVTPVENDLTFIQEQLFGHLVSYSLVHSFC